MNNWKGPFPNQVPKGVFRNRANPDGSEGPGNQGGSSSSTTNFKGANLNKVLHINNATANFAGDIVMRDNGGPPSTSNSDNLNGSETMVVRIENADFNGRGVNMTSGPEQGGSSASTDQGGPWKLCDTSLEQSKRKLADLGLVDFYRGTLVFTNCVIYLNSLFGLFFHSK